MFCNKKNSATNNFQLSVTQDLSWKIRTTQFRQDRIYQEWLMHASFYLWHLKDLILLLQHYYYQEECVINIRNLESTQNNVVVSKEKCKVDTCMLSSFQSLDILGRKQEQRLKYSYLPKPECNIDDIYEYDDNKQQKHNVIAWCFRGT